MYNVCYMLWKYSLFVYFWLSYFFLLYFKCVHQLCEIGRHLSYICLVCDFSLMFADRQQRAAADCIYDCSRLSNKAQSAWVLKCGPCSVPYWSGASQTTKSGRDIESRMRRAPWSFAFGFALKALIQRLTWVLEHLNIAVFCCRCFISLSSTDLTEGSTVADLLSLIIDNRFRRFR